MPPIKPRASSSRSFQWDARRKNARMATGLSFLHRPAGEVRRLIPGYAVKVDHAGRAKNNVSKHDSIILHSWSYVKMGI
jgi:hypothetical protein